MGSENALDRLQRLSEPSNEREFTLEEQMDSVSTDEFLDGMSLAAKTQMNHLVEEVVIEEPKDTSNDSSNDSEELFNNKPKRAYNRKNKPAEKVEEKQTSNTSTTTAASSNPVFDQVVKDLIDDLRERNYKINRFDDKSMSMIFDYMYTKF